MPDPHDAVHTGRLDLVPMIDCVMLLLLFFILTTRFVSADRQVAMLLPVPAPPRPYIGAIQPRINVVLTPTDLPRGLPVHAYQRGWERLAQRPGARPLMADLCVGSSDALVVDLARLGSSDPRVAAAELAAIHAYLARELDLREQRGSRSNRADIAIHCFSGLSWGYALAAYDGVRAYDGSGQPDPAAAGATGVKQRSVAFAPPSRRTCSIPPHDTELWELKNTR